MLHAIIMAGGSGTRFWPKSRRKAPKQLLRLFGEASMLQQTAGRIAPLVPPERLYVITGADQVDAVRAQLPDVPAANVVAEPCPRDTAPCVGLAAAIVARTDPDATMVVMPADHVIRPDAVFQRTVAAAVEQIDADPTAFVTFGIRPTRPETGYGYIERGEELGRPHGILLNKVVRFREKPNRETAEEFLATGRFSWNSGIFLWRAKTVLNALREHRPGLAEGIDTIARDLGTPQEADTIARVFPTLEKVPIDRAVMEHYPNVRVLEVTYDWSDVGDWRSLAELLETDTHGNTSQGSALLVESRGTVVINDDSRLIAALGVEDLVIVQSAGATLVARRDQLDRLKAMVEGLGPAGFEDLL